MQNVITRKLVENIAYNDSLEFSDNINKKVNNLLSLAIDELSKVNPYINLDACGIQPINETFNGAYIPGSNYEYFIGFASPQIELNSLTYSNWWSKFKKKFKEAWISSSRRLSKNRAKRIKAGIVEEKNIVYGYEKYTIENLLEDLQDACVNYLSSGTIVYRNSRYLKIIGKEEFGANTQIIIHSVIAEDSEYKYFISKKKGFKSYDFTNRAILNNAKFEKLGDNYLYILKLMNHLLREFTKMPTNQYFLESLVYNLPEEFVKGNDIYKNFIKIINFLRSTDISDYTSIMDPSKTIFTEENSANYGYNYSKFLKTFDKVILKEDKK